MQVNVDDVADELYGLPAEEFTAARDEAARRAPDPAAKKAIKALRKPTAAAAEVNRLVRSRPGDLDDLLDLGDRLRTAMRDDPTDVRRLTDERRALVNSLVGRDLPAATRADVAATLEAATADPELGAAVRSGRLVKPLRYAGFGALPDLGDAVATRPRSAAGRAARQSPPTTPGPAKPSQPRPTPKQPSTPGPDLSAARDRVLELAGLADDAQRRYESAVKAATEARKLLEAAEAERAESLKAARAAHADAERARRDLGRLERS